MNVTVHTVTVDCERGEPLVEFWSQATDVGSGFVVLADPGGNEFCVEREKAERTAVG